MKMGNHLKERRAGERLSIPDKIGQLNDAWSQLQSESREWRRLLVKVLSMHTPTAEKYKELHDTLNAWLTGMEARAKKEETLHLKQQLEEMKVHMYTDIL